MRLAIVTAVWKRPEVFDMFAQGIKMLQVHFVGRVDIICCIAGSEGSHSREMVEKHHNFFYTEAPNHPLHIKFNQATRLAYKLGADYCLMIGSDDIIGKNLMDRYYVIMQKGIDYAYLTDCYFFDTVTKNGLYWGGYIAKFNKGKGAGIGRLISKRALDKINWICWPPGYDRVLDTGFDKQMDRLICSKVEINLRREKLFALDIKSSTNMTPFALWDNSLYTNGKDLLFNNLPKELAELIMGNTTEPLEDVDNYISPDARVHPNVIMGKGNRIMEGAIIREGVQLGDNNYIGPYCIIGDIPEKVEYFDKPGRVVIGNNNRFTKQVTIDGSTDGLTVIKNNVIMLKNAHVGHDARVNDKVVLSCNVCIGGHTVVNQGCNFGLGAVAHQRLEIPEYSMVGMNTTITKKTVMEPGRKLVGSPARDIGSNLK